MAFKSKLYELIQRSQNSKYDFLIECPTFNYDDDFDRNTNSHCFTCIADIIIEDAKYTFTSNSFKTKKNANNDVCHKIYEFIMNNSKKTNESLISSNITKLIKYDNQNDHYNYDDV